MNRVDSLLDEDTSNGDITGELEMLARALDYDKMFALGRLVREAIQTIEQLRKEKTNECK